MHLGQLANCLMALMMIEQSYKSKTIALQLSGGGPFGPNTGKGCTIGFLTVLKHPKPNLSSRH